MHVMYFTEQPMSAYPAEIGLEAGHTALMFSNKHFDPIAGSELYARSLRQARLEIVPNSGHCVDMEQPEALARLVTPFIEQNQS